MEVVPSLTLDLPWPPSVNATSKRLGNQDASVQAWVRNADVHRLQQRDTLNKRIDGTFTIVITWKRKAFGLFDVDNRIKFLMDYLQNNRIISNDKWCWELRAWWGEAPAGCRVQLEAVDVEND